MVDYVSLRDRTVDAALVANGIEVRVVREVGGIFDPAKGTWVSPPTDAALSVSALFTKIKQAEGPDGLKMRVQEMLLSASPFNTAGIVPTTSMRIEWGGKSYGIVWVDPLAPGGVDLFYTVQIKL